MEDVWAAGGLGCAVDGVSVDDDELGDGLIDVCRVVGVGVLVERGSSTCARDDRGSMAARKIKLEKSGKDRVH